MPGAALGRAGARRAALHRHPPGLRALVQGDAARGGVPPAVARGRRHRHGARGDEADPDDPEDGRRAGRRPRDDDAARVPELPRPARARERLPVGAVPRARGGAGPARRGRARRPPAGARPRPDHRRHGAAEPVRVVPRVRRPRRPSAGGGAGRPGRRVPHGRRSSPGLRADGRHRRGHPGVALPARQDGASARSASSRGPAGRRASRTCARRSSSRPSPTSGRSGRGSRGRRRAARPATGRCRREPSTGRPAPSRWPPTR